jgi:hypothetical protein
VQFGRAGVLGGYVGGGIFLTNHYQFGFSIGADKHMPLNTFLIIRFQFGHDINFWVGTKKICADQGHDFSA